MKRKFTILTAALALLACLTIPLGMWGQTTYSLQKVTSVEAGGLYVFEQDGHVMNNTVSSSALQTTDSYLTVGLNGTESYVWTLEAATNGFYMKNVSLSNNQYLNNASSTNVSFGSKNSIWGFTFQTDETVLIQNKSNSSRFLGYTTSTSYAYKAYAQGNLSSYPHAVVVYKLVEDSGTTSDLALVNAPVELTFDLYNNSNSQVIEYTTSSTGTVSVVENNYITAEVNQTNKTITVTPVAVTNGAQTITVNQVADQNYNAGTVSFTVTITDSTPFAGGVVTFVAGTDTGTSTGQNPDEMTKSGVTVSSTSAALATSEYRLYSGSTTTISTSAGTITEIVFTGNSTSYPVSRLSVNNGNGTYSTNNNNVGTWTGDAASVSFSADGQARASQIAVTVTVSSGVATTTTINVPANFNNDIYQGTTAGTLTATVTENVNNTPINNATVTWESSNTGVATIDVNGEVTLVAVGTTTITASYAGVEDQYRPSEGTYELTVTDSNAPGTQNNPYTVAQAIAATPSSGTSDNVYIHGIVSRFQNNSIMGDGTNYRYYISDDGTSSTELLVYKGKGLNNVAFSNANDLLIGDVVTIYGGLTTYNNTKEIAADNYIVSLVRPNQYNLTNAMTNVHEYHVFVGETEIEFDNNNQAQVRAGATVYVSLTMEDCYDLTSLTVNGSTTGVTEIEPGIYYSFVMPEGDATIGVLATQATQHTLTVVGLNNVTYTDILAGLGSEEVTLTNNQATLCEGINVDIVGLSANAGLLLESVTLNDGTTTTTLELEYGVYHFTMPSSNATLTFTTTTAQTYTLATTIESGKTYIIVGFDDDDAYAMAEQKSSNRAGVAITVDGTTATGNADVHEVVITALDGNDAGKYTIEVVDGYLYASSSTANQLKTETTLDANGNGKWTIVIVDGEATITAQGTNSRKLMRFNPNNGSPLFACYATNNTTGSLPKLYVKDETPATETFELTITGYGSSAKGGWNLIASPVSTTPDQVTNMLTEETATPYSYDLYRFNQAAESEWENYHQHSGDFNIVPGKGYLYANKGNVNNNPNTVTLTFEGVPYSGNGVVDLVYSEDNEDANMHGWNLIGNPFSTAATLNMPFFKMNGTGSGFTSQNANSSVAAMEGVLVYAYDDGASQPISTATFTAAGRSNSESATMVNIVVVSSFGDVMDNAIVNFNEGIQLPKFYFGTQNANIYIPQGNKEYAIVSTEAQGEMPVNFKAAENGTYTFTVNPVGVEMNYLHLIDNMTGMDVDLLQTPSYSFHATIRDYESRFRLVFAANNEDGASTGSTAFAFFSNGNWIINNAGEATLQVIDLTGRILSSETVNGSVSTTINAVPGVYMLRLINGENVNVQKIVVR